MEPVDNNQFEVKPNPKVKRKIASTCSNVYHNPALDILANEDPMCNNAMEIQPKKKRKSSRSCDIAAFENSALDLGISKAAVNEFLVRELENVKKNIRCTGPKPVNIVKPTSINGEETFVQEMREDSIEVYDEVPLVEPIYENIGNPMLYRAERIEVTESSSERIEVTESSSERIEVTDSSSERIEGTESSFERIEVTESSSERIAGTESSSNFQVLDSTDSIPVITTGGISALEPRSRAAISGNIAESFYAGNLSKINHTANITNNIFINNQTNLSLSFIDRLALDSPNVSNQSLYLDDDLNESNIMEVKTITIITKKKIVPERKKNTNPFLNISPDECAAAVTAENPFLSIAGTSEMEYEPAVNQQTQIINENANIQPRRLFANETSSTISTQNESTMTNEYETHEYENVESFRAESPIYENVGDETADSNYNKQSKVLGHDVTRFSSRDIMNLNKNSQNHSNNSNDSRKDLKHTFLRAGNRLSKRVFKTLKKTFKTDKPEPNVTLNPYEIPRKLPKKKPEAKDSGIENPALNIDNSDEIEIEEIDDDIEHQYETIKTLRNTRLNMNVTPLKERTNEADNSQNKTHTPGKKVRFDSTLNQEKVITGNSFDCGVQSPGFDAKIEKFHDELENCINERKFIQQNISPWGSMAPRQDMTPAEHLPPPPQVAAPPPAPPRGRLQRPPQDHPSNYINRRVANSGNRTTNDSR